MPTIVADNNIALLTEQFSHLGDIIAKPGRKITKNDVKNADILLVRSITKVNENLLANSNIKFVGSVTSGADHIDINYLKSCGIKFVAATGCNASSVVEYVLSAINFFANNKVDLTNCSVGIIGVGNIGLRLHYALYKLGIKTLLNDPFEPIYNCQLPKLNYMPLAEVLAKADIISLHCPLTTTGEYPSYHLLNKNNLSTIKPNSCIINSSRGAVVDNTALARYLANSNSLNLAFDVWENEPNINLSLLDKCQIATPHIAGYSKDAKLLGSQLVYSELANYLKKKHDNTIALTNFWENFTANKLTDKQKIADAFNGINNNYDIIEDTKKLKKIFNNNSINSKNQKQLFDNLRQQYINRRQFNLMKFINN